MNFLRNESQYFLFFFLILIFFFITLNQGNYSDDFQFIIGIDLYNKIQSQSFLKLRDLLTIRSDGHFIPVGLLLFNFLPKNPISYHLVTCIFYFITSIYVFKLSKIIFKDKKISIIVAILFIMNLSISIKPLTWNCFNSHIINTMTGLGFIYYFLIAKLNSKSIYYVISILLGVITVLNFETGLIYPIILFFFLLIFYKEKKYTLLLLSLFPLSTYFIPILFLKNNESILLTDRIFSSKVIDNFSYDLRSLIFESRARNADRTFINYFLRLFDNILSVVNLSSLEFVMIKFYIEKKIFLLGSIILLVIFLLISYFYLIISFFKEKLYKDKFFLKILIMFNIVLSIYSFVFFRKDINIGLSVFGAILLGYVLKLFIKNNFSKFIYLIIIFIFPTIIYAMTKFDYVYEMKSRNYIHEMNIVFNKNLDKDISNLNRHYFYQDYIFMHLNENYDKFKNDLAEYNYDSFWNFQENLFYDIKNVIENN